MHLRVHRTVRGAFHWQPGLYGNKLAYLRTCSHFTFAFVFYYPQCVYFHQNILTLCISLNPTLLLVHTHSFCWPFQLLPDLWFVPSIAAIVIAVYIIVDGALALHAATQADFTGSAGVAAR